MADRLVLLTRPLEQSEKVASELEEAGIASLIWPLTRIVPAFERVDIPAGTQALLFTSANGVRAFAALLGERALPALCVGGTTAAAARTAGFTDVRSAEGDARALADLARASGLRRFLHLRGADVAGDLAGDLAAAGITVDQAVVYRAEETGPPPAQVTEALAAGQIAVVTVWSPRAGRLLARHLAGADLGQTALAAISPAATAPLTDSGFATLRTAETPSREGMLAAIHTIFRCNPG